MAEDSWPSPGHNDRAVTDREYELLAARFSDDGVYGGPTDTPVVSAGPGLAVTVRPGVQASIRGHAWDSGTTPLVLPVTPNATGYTRHDRICLRLSRADWTVRAIVRSGVPGALSPPSLVRTEGDTGNWDIPLATATVLGNAASVTVVRRELYVGSRIRSCTSGNRPTVADVGDLAYEVDTGRLMVHTDLSGGWAVLYAPPQQLVVDSMPGAWLTEVSSTLETSPGAVHLRLGTWIRNAANLAAATDSRLPVVIPAAYRHPNRNIYAGAYITGGGFGRLTIYSANTDKAGQVWLTQKPQVNRGNYVLPTQVSWSMA
ncbi:hypothetical protein [Streptomyces albidoflavus]|uniref:hypothetical protein n=1 Tax=Streptomyces albidoflavus TaxID=1886 RepID=UPI0033C319C6